MPKPLKEYRCLAHGEFESRAIKAHCPHGCTTVVQEFRTPPMISTNRSQTQMQDNLQQMLASRYNLSDLKTPDPGQTMSQKLRSTGSTMQTGPVVNPTSVQEAISQAAQGQGRGTVSVPIDAKVTSRNGQLYLGDRTDQNLSGSIAHTNPAVLRAAAQNEKQIDPVGQAKAKLARAEVVNRPNPGDKEDLGKAMTELGAA